MASYTLDLPPNPSADDIYSEKEFVRILHSSLDNTSPTYNEDKANFEKLMEDLEGQYLAAIARASTGQWSAEGLQASHQRSASASSSSSLLSLDTPGSGSSHGVPNARPDLFSYGQPNNSKKRGISGSQEHSGPNHSVSKRPSPAGTPSSLGAAQTVDWNGNGHLHPSHHTFGGNTAIQPSSTSPYQQPQPTGGYASFQPEIVALSTPYQTRLPSRPPVLGLSSNTPNWSFAANANDNALPSPNEPTPSRTSLGPPSKAIAHVNDNIVDLTGDDSSEIGDNDWNAAFTAYAAQPSGFTNLPQANLMPGSFPAEDLFGELDLAYTGQQTDTGPTFGQYVASPLTLDRDGTIQQDNADHANDNFMAEPELAQFLVGPPLNGQQEALAAPAMNGIAHNGLVNRPSGGFPPGYRGIPWQFGNSPYEDDDDDVAPPPPSKPEDFDDIIQNIRPDEEIPREQREQTPMQMSTQLMEHQKLGLAWLKKMETGTNKGGILADDMGLGKTVQALSLILSRPSADPLRKTTLIIAPVALMRQWESEIKNKVLPEYRLNVYVYHGTKKKVDWATLRRYDVVLTTFGTLGVELKNKYEWTTNVNNESIQVRSGKKLALLSEECRWYRVIIDEAQCIKNRSTNGAKAAYELQSIYRLCMTGTPMMNSVDELFSLIHFLRIRPYNDWGKFKFTFSLPLKKEGTQKQTQLLRDRTMQTLQALLRSVLLRRTKDSLIDGRPIITIPPKHVEQTHVAFSKDEQELYRALETKSQVQFNRYLKQNSVSNNYANILLLLLRLRQACCHPHLITDLNAESAASGMEENTLLDLAKSLRSDVVHRLKGQEGFECPICIDAIQNPTIFVPCGHHSCADCFQRLVDPARALQQGEEAAKAKCPSCRGDISAKKITDLAHFVKAFMPETLKQEDQEEVADSASASESDDEESEEDEDEETLNGFIVPDSEAEDGQSDGFNNATARVRPKHKKNNNDRDKGKGKARAEPKQTLAELKKASMRNKAAKAKYLRRLRRQYQSSAKIDKTMELINDISNNDPTEKIIIFSQWTSLLDLLEVPLHDLWDKDKTFGYQRYDGSMKSDDRASAVNDFMENPNTRLMLISLKAGNAGLNLNKASQVIILDPDQAVDRAHRMMQKREVHVHRVLVPETVEDRILALQDKKRTIIQTALDERAGGNIARLGVGELRYLFGTSDRL